MNQCLIRDENFKRLPETNLSGRNSRYIVNCVHVRFSTLKSFDPHVFDLTGTGHHRPVIGMELEAFPMVTSNVIFLHSAREILDADKLGYKRARGMWTVDFLLTVGTKIS